MSINRCFNISDLQRLARKRLPNPIYHYLEGGADDESTLARNMNAFADYELMPRTLIDTTGLDMSTEVLGQKIDWPVIIAPTGMSRMFHHDGERAVARAAERFGTMYSLSTMASVTIEEIGKLTKGPKLYQIYIHKDRGLTREFIQRCKESGYDALCLTVDTSVAGNRERDMRTGMTMPPKLTPRSLLSFAAHPRWSLNMLLREKLELVNVAHRVDTGSLSIMEYARSQFDRSLNWDDVAKVIEEWGGPFAIKGILSPEDARQAVAVGASAVMIGNHGGRQLDSVPAPVDCIVPILDAVGDRLEVILDGGVRRGTDVIKALALGARACMIGRAYLYGLAAGGQAGVERALWILREELERDMVLLGCPGVRELNREFLF